MTRILRILAISLVLAGCGSSVDLDVGDTTSSPSSTEPTSSSPTTEPNADQLAQLQEARAKWEANRPATYAFEYALGCECDQGPFRVEVDAAGVGTVTHLSGGSTEFTYDSIDAIFDEIAQALLDDEVPVRAEYDAELGYPGFYVWNEPELPVDGGFTVEITRFETDPAGRVEAARAELERHRRQWERSGVVSYDYTFQRLCFCPEEYVGPYEVQVHDGEVVSATFGGTDLLDLDPIDIGAYDELILTIDALFDEIERSIGAVADVTVEYDTDDGHPTSVQIDVETNMADDEITYVVENLRPAGTGVDQCSTSAATIDLVPQPDLPAEVATTRAAIHEAAMACDISALVALTAPDGFNASFGGGEAATLWTEAELRGQPVLLDLVRHLNQAYTEFGDGGDITGYVWPSAFLELEAPDGRGLPADEFAELLTLYTEQELDEMFAGIGGYVGYRIGIEPDGDWIYFVAGD